jgi:hypothetical protein
MPQKAKGKYAVRANVVTHMGFGPEHVEYLQAKALAKGYGVTVGAVVREMVEAAMKRDQFVPSPEKPK